MPVLDCGELFKHHELHMVQALRADIAEMDDLPLNYWVFKFVLILWTLMIKVLRKFYVEYSGNLKFIVCRYFI